MIHPAWRGVAAAWLALALGFVPSIASAGAAPGAFLFLWSIDKSASTDSLTVAPGQSFSVDYSVALTPSHSPVGVQEDIDECVNVSDSLAGALGQVCFDPTTFNYTFLFPGYATPGIYSLVNTASFTALDTGATGSDSWTVRVTVPGTVPEPGTVELLGFGIILAAVAAIRRNRSTS